MGPDRKIPILMYHGLFTNSGALRGKTPGEVHYSLALSEFEQQIEALSAKGYTGVSLRCLVDGGGLDKVAKPLVVTFDDGLESDWCLARPVIQRMGWKSEHFVTVGWIGTPGYMTWEQIKKLDELGNGVQSHTVGHRDLGQLEDDAVHYELAESKKQLETHLGRTVEFLSLPGGTGVPRACAIAKEIGYKAICTSLIGRNGARTDPFRLRRIPVTRQTRLDDLLRWVDGRGLRALWMKKSAWRVGRRFLGKSFYEGAKAVLLRRAYSLEGKSKP